MPAAGRKKKIKALSEANIDLSGKAPLHGQVRMAIHNGITNGDFPTGAILPGEKDLAEQFNVSRITVKRALNDLALAGLVRRSRGRGTMVTYGAAHPVIRGSFTTLLDSLRTMGLETDVDLLSADAWPVTKEIAATLDIKKGAKVQRAIRIRRLEDEPFSYLVTYVPLDIAAKYEIDELSTTPILTLLERAGVKVTEAEQTLTAVAATKDIADHLLIAAGAPLMKISRIMRDSNQRPIQMIEAHYRPEKFQYHMRMSRRRTRDGETWSDIG